MYKKRSFVVKVLAVAVIATGVGLFSDGAKAGASDACGATRYKANGLPWACSFNDDFSPLAVGVPNKNGVDATKWRFHDTSVQGFFQGNTCFRTTSDVVNASNGTLKINVTQAPTYFKCIYNGGPDGILNTADDKYFTTRYTSEAITTYDLFNQTYGAYEIRAKLPVGRSISGLHGAYWMTPPHSPYGAWPRGGEIDIAEWWSRTADKNYHFLHYDGWQPFAWTNGVFGWGRDAGECATADPHSWHTYRLEWEPSIMKFFLDGSLCGTIAWDSSQYDHAGAPFDAPFSINLQMGVDSDDKIDPKMTFPQTYEVDYAKAWR